MSIGSILNTAAGRDPCTVKDVEHRLLDGLNPEQREVVLHDKGPLLAGAVAGAGKTHALIRRVGYLVAVRGVHPSRVLAVTFSKKGADEMQERLDALIGKSDARIGTFHSLAYEILRTEVPAYRKWKIDDRNRYRICLKDATGYKEMNWKEADVTVLEQFVGLCKCDLARPESDIAFNIAETIHKRNPKATTRPHLMLEAYSRAEDIRRERQLLGFDDMLMEAVELLRDDDDLRRRWASKYDYVLQDEAQDQNLCQLLMGELLAKDHRNYMLVGDPAQCHPAGTKILTDDGEVSIENLADNDTVKGWNRKSQKMIGGRRVRVGKRRYDGPLVRLNLDTRSVTMTPDHKVLARWTNRDDRETCVVYLMYREGLGYRVGWCQLFASRGSSRNFHLVTRTKLEKADKVWILHVTDDRTDASVTESIISIRYGIPTTPFEPVNGAQHLTRTSIDRLFSEVGRQSIDGGEQALCDRDLDPDLPLWPWPAQQVKDKDNEVAYRRGTYFPVYAANVLPGLMSLPLPDDRNLWAPVDGTRREEYHGFVYSLDVEQDHSYSANDIVVLNCIYTWRGARPEKLLQFEQSWNAHLVTMGRNYRCGQVIIDAANNMLDAMAPETKLDMKMVGERGIPGEAIATEYDDLDEEGIHITEQIQALMVDGTILESSIPCCEKCTNALYSRYAENRVGHNRSARVVRNAYADGTSRENSGMQQGNDRPDTKNPQSSEKTEPHRNLEREVEGRPVRDEDRLHIGPGGPEKVSNRAPGSDGKEARKAPEKDRGDSPQKRGQDEQRTRQSGAIREQLDPHEKPPSSSAAHTGNAKDNVQVDGNSTNGKAPGDSSIHGQSLVDKSGNPTPCTRCQSPATNKIEIIKPFEPRDAAILFRTNAQSRAPEEALISARIPYRIIGGASFYERREVKNLLAYLRLAEGRGDLDDIGRAINTPFRFLGRAFVDRVRDAAKETKAHKSKEGTPSWPTIIRDVCRQAGVQRRQMYSAEDWASIIEDIQFRVTRASNADPESETKAAGMPARILEDIIRQTGYVEWLQKDEGEESTENSRVSNIREMVRAAERFTSVSDLLDYVDNTLAASRKQRKDGGDNPNKVTLCSLHRSKGLEWPMVFVAGASEKILPHGRCEDMEEERRLFYVGVTRARDRLAVSCVRNVAFGTKVLFTEPSRFIEEAGMSLEVVESNFDDED